MADETEESTTVDTESATEEHEEHGEEQAQQDDAKPSRARAPKIEGSFDADRAARLIERLRNETKAEKEARQAAEAKSADTLRAVAKALGLAEEDKPDPEALARQLAETQAAEKQRRVENLVLRIAPALGADPDALLDSNAFLKVISQYEPGDREAVEDTVKDFMAKSTRYSLPSAVKSGDEKEVKTQSRKPAGRSGADMSGAGSSPRQWTQAELDAASAQGRHADIVNAQKAGLLDAIMNGA